MKELITANLDIWSAAVTAKTGGAGRSSSNKGAYGINKLRELILELAVRGKLVPQDPNDEPARDLLKKIRKEKDRLVSEGKLKTSKPSHNKNNDKMFELPQSWEWVRLDDISLKITDGEHISPPKSLSGMPLLTAKDVTEKGLVMDDPQYVTLEDGFRSRKRCDPEIGDVLICSRGTIGRCATVDVDEIFCLMGSVILVKNSAEIYHKYIQRYLQTPVAQKWMRGASYSTAVSALYLKDVKQCPASLPPVAEQHRIVAKVDELMALCDQLETEQATSVEAHEKLVSILLDALIQGDNFTESWARLREHFDVLFTTPASIDKLKQTLLQLAVMGKLVSQDPNDEPASELLKKIRKEKDKLIAEGKIKKDKPLSPITEDEKHFSLPIGWEWVRLNDVVQFTTGKLDSNAAVENGKYPFFTCAKDPLLIDRYSFDCEAVLLAGNNAAGKYDVKHFSGKFNVYQRTYVITTEFGSNSVVTYEYLKNLLVNMLEVLQSKSLGTLTKFLTLGILKPIVIELPPLAEQQRIVAKVNELIGLCDQMKSKLVEAGEQQRKLADVMVERAVA